MDNLSEPRANIALRRASARADGEDTDGEDMLLLYHVLCVSLLTPPIIMHQPACDADRLRLAVVRIMLHLLGQRAVYKKLYIGSLGSPL